MAGQPSIAGKPIVILQQDDGYSVEMWMPPQGIWRRIGETESSPDAPAAVRYASAIAQYGASIVLQHISLPERSESGSFVRVRQLWQGARLEVCQSDPETGETFTSISQLFPTVVEAREQGERLASQLVLPLVDEAAA